MNFHAATRKITSSRFHTLLLYCGRHIGGFVCVCECVQRIFAMKSAQFVKRNNKRRFGGPKPISRERTQIHSHPISRQHMNGWMNEWIGEWMTACVHPMYGCSTQHRDGERERENARVLKSTIIALSGYKFCECVCVYEVLNGLKTNAPRNGANAAILEKQQRTQNAVNNHKH